jgi:hypothetical protein
MHGAAGYNGPWIENVWIRNFSARAEEARTAGRPLSSVFGPYIPILVPFTDLWVHGGPKQQGHKRYRYPTGLVHTLREALRPDVAYIAVSQNDEGLSGRAELPMAAIPNVLVLSAGGYGHVPVPLLKQAEPSLRGTPPNRRRYLVSYVGSVASSAAGGFRARMRGVVATTATKEGFQFKLARGLGPHWSVFLSPRLERLVALVMGVDSWRGVIEASRTILCPRGHGRSSYHLAETVQMGRLPIHVFTDTPWLPYEALFANVGFATDLANLPALLRWLRAQLSDAELERREKTLGQLRESHFTFAGVMEQISSFMVVPHRSDLRCRRLPETSRPHNIT